MCQSSDFNFDENFLKEVFEVETTNKYEINKSQIPNKFQLKMKTNKQSDVVRTTSTLDVIGTRHRKVVQRKFPGPAGILPQQKESYTTFICDQDTTLDSSKLNEPEEIVCSQFKDDMFSNCSSPWMRMRKDWCIEPHYLVDHYTIAWLKSKVNKHELTEKSPFLAAVIQSINNTVLVLADRNAEIQATVTPELWTKYASVLCPGAVLVLKHTPFLAAMRKLFLTLTLNTLVAIYTEQGDVINVQDITSDDIVREIQQIQSPSVVAPTTKVTQANPFFKRLSKCIQEATPPSHTPNKKFSFEPRKNSGDANETKFENEILTQVLDGVDTSSLFDDF